MVNHKKIKISIIIPFYNNNNDLENLLLSIRKNFNFSVIKMYIQIIIVDDGSTKNMIKFNNYYNIECIKKKNGGASSARNLGAKFAKGEYFLFLDSDTELPKNFLIRLLKFINEKKNLKVCSFYYREDSFEKNDAFSAKFRSLLDTWNNIGDFNKNKIIQDKIIHGQSVIFQRQLFFYSHGWDVKIYKSIVENEEFSKRIKNICRLTTNFQIGVFHYYKRMDIIFKDIFYRSKIWTEFYIKGKVIKDKRFSSFSVITKLIPLMFLISIFFYKITVIPIFLCIISYLVFNLNLFLFILNKTNIKILIFSVIFYFIFLLFATLGLMAGLSTQIVKILYSKFKFLNQNEYNNYKT
jgi:glycosyltransferase involved in cell wall biosynthesis